MAKVKYKISSRATILIGRESVPKAESAIIELIKNTYDADAGFCCLYFNVENDEIIILDNGIGMTEEIIKNQWMMIGTDNKRYDYKSEKNRIKSGEKGIGRFSLDRLGEYCKMYTKNKNSKNLILWEMDWGTFEERGKTLDDIEANLEFINTKYIEVIPEEILEEIKNKKIDVNISFEAGTMIVIRKLRDNWTEKMIENLVQSMGFLIPPTENKEYLLCFKKKKDKELVLIEDELSNEFDYRLEAKFDGEKFNIKLKRNEFDLNIFCST